MSVYFYLSVILMIGIHLVIYKKGYMTTSQVFINNNCRKAQKGVAQRDTFSICRFFTMTINYY